MRSWAPLRVGVQENPQEEMPWGPVTSPPGREQAGPPRERDLAVMEGFQEPLQDCLWEDTAQFLFPQASWHRLKGLPLLHPFCPLSHKLIHLGTLLSPSSFSFPRSELKHLSGSRIFCHLLASSPARNSSTFCNTCNQNQKSPRGWHVPQTNNAQPWRAAEALPLQRCSGPLRFCD